MQNFFSHCIFCFEPLSERDKKGSGDHIIPAYLYGSLCTKDVCVRCNNTLGQVADHRSLEDARIISAIRELELPDLHAQIRDRGTGKLVDATDGSERPVRFKKGRPRVVPGWANEEMFVCDEAEITTHLARLLQKSPSHGMSNSQIEDMVKHDLKERLKQLKPGELINEPGLGLRIRKAPGTIHHEPRVTEGACERLVAKIGYEVACIAFEKKRLLALPELDIMAAVAKGEGRLGGDILMYPLSTYSPVNAPPKGPKYHHQIVVLFEEYANIIDIYFFGCVGFRLFLRGDSLAALGPCPFPDGDLDMVSFVMTFEPGTNKDTIGFIRRAGQEEVEQMEIA